MHNFPNTIQIGDVRNVDVSQLPYIQIIAGGSPCQSFSFAGKRAGMSTVDKVEVKTLEHYLQLKAENFEFEGQSYLFWEFMRILEDVRKYNQNVIFFLENVEMGKKWEGVLSRAIGCYPQHIDSDRFSAQHRKRLYWTNISQETRGMFGEKYTHVPLEPDKHIYIKDIVEEIVDEKYYINKGSKIYQYITDKKRLKKKYTQIDGSKSIPLMARMYENWTGNYINVAERGRGGKQELEPTLDGKSNCLTTVAKDNYLGELIGCDYRSDEGIRIRKDGKGGTLCARERNDESCGQLLIQKYRLRRYIPRECCRQQSIPEWYKIVEDDKYMYKMLGNGWEIEAVKQFWREYKHKIEANE
jgi:DNA (cytosine-5)-methyltransferase 3A